jgi:hypothetical protein
MIMGAYDAEIPISRARKTRKESLKRAAVKIAPTATISQ